MESLSSYVTRVAHNHQLAPDTLLTEVVLPETSIADAHRGSSFFRTHLKTMNSYGKYSREISSALERLTGSRNIELLTLLPVSSALDAKGTGAMAEHPRWCKTCLNLSRRLPGGAFMQLAWQVAGATHCIAHWTALTDSCPHCHRQQRAVPRHNLLGHCSECGKWLGDGPEQNIDALSPHEAHRARFHSLAVAELIMLGASRPRCDDLAAQLRAGLQKCVDAYADGATKKLEALTGMSNGQVRHWLTEGRPGLRPLLELAYALACTPAAMIEGLVPDVTSARARFRPWAHAARCTVRQVHGTETSLTLAGCLAEAAAMVPPPTIASVVQRANVTTGYLKYWHPDAARALAERRSQYLAQERVRKNDSIRALAKQTVREMVESPGALNRRIIDLQLNSLGLSLKHPHARAGMHEALHANCHPSASGEGTLNSGEG